ncbi:MAG: acyl--CoA ligase [Pseudomonadota bacterium]
MSQTLQSLVEQHDTSAYCVGAPDRAWLTYGHLAHQSTQVANDLHAFGIALSDRVAVVLPNGPDMAVAYFTIAQAACVAPLNPGYRLDEYVFYLDDLGAKAVVIDEAYDGPALSAAKKLGLSIITVHSKAEAGAFELKCTDSTPLMAPSGEPTPDDVALILHTSGTTSRPKIVPLTQGNLAASASNIATSLGLTRDDRCLNVMPLFHIHGLVAAISATFQAGACVWCAPGFDALKFFGWMQTVRPTWYTAVPTMHQAILARAPRNKEIVETTPLRFLRSSSASLPAQVMKSLQASFGVPVVEAYGMTEAAHQMCCNPMETRKFGSVGVASGPDVAIAHETQSVLTSGVGEVVISGENVTPGYENNVEANQKSFFEIDGKRWFRTGDQGTFDDDGFLFLTGRLKEIINRGGEKISPLEVDDVLMDHPSVAQVVTFSIPHDKLGEDVGAAIVLKEGQLVEVKEIKAFAADKLAAFKVPKTIVILDEIPKGATGKMQRIGMAEKLGLL